MIGKSPNREEYVRLLEAGWSSMALERYASHRYGEDVPASTFRTFRQRQGIKVPVSRFGEIVDPERMVDVMGLRQEAIQLQMERIRIDNAHESSMGKLFSSTRGEIQLLNQLLDSAKGDLQDLGMFPKAGETVDMTVKSGPSVAEAPKHRTLGDALGVDGEAAQDLARVLHLATKRPVVKPGVNGKSGSVAKDA